MNVPPIGNIDMVIRQNPLTPFETCPPAVFVFAHVKTAYYPSVTPLDGKDGPGTVRGLHRVRR